MVFFSYIQLHAFLFQVLSFILLMIISVLLNSFLKWILPWVQILFIAKAIISGDEWKIILKIKIPSKNII